MLNQILEILERNSRLTHAQIAAMIGAGEEEVCALIKEAEDKGIIRAYQAIIDWDKTNRDICIARIEIKVTPKKDMGFEEIAHRIADMHEVNSIYLMSGGYDFAVTVSAKTFKDVAMFVAKRLAPLESVESTSTHFVLRKYKDHGVFVLDPPKDEREVTTL